MRDIVSTPDGLDLGVALSTLPKAANVLAIQLGDLEYAREFGVDKRYFLNQPFLFQNESYRAHLIEKLTENQINVSAVRSELDALSGKNTFYIQEPPVTPDFSPLEIVQNALTDADGAPLLDADGRPLTDVIF